MTNYTELKRLAEAAKAAFSNSYEHTSNRVDFEMAASPDVVLSMIDALDVQAGSIEAVQAANQRLAAERDKLRTQNQALVKEMRHIAGISNGQVKRVADQALAAQAEGGGMTDAITREDVIRMAKESGFKACVGTTDKEGNYHPFVNALGKDIPIEWLERFAALAALRAKPGHSELVKDAARYRWLREQHWSGSKFAVVSNPKTAVNLGSICPSRELLDEAIDEAMAAIGEAT